MKLLAMSACLRLLLVCAAVSPFTCSASPVSTQVDNGVKLNILGSLNPDHNQNPPAPLPNKTVAQTGTDSETGISETLRETLSIIDPQSNRQQSSYDQNRPRDDQRPGTGINEARRGHRAGGMRPASVIFTRQRLRGPPPRGNYQPTNGNAYNYAPALGKASQTGTGTRFYQGFIKVWPPENPQILYNEAQHPDVYSSKVSGGDSDSSLLAALTPGAPSISGGLDASVIESDPSPEKLTPTITDFSRGMNSASGSETKRYKKAQLYLLKGSQTSFTGRETIKKGSGDGARRFPVTPHEQQASAAPARVKLSSHFIRFHPAPEKPSSSEVQRSSNNVRQTFTNSTVAHRSAQTHSLTPPPPVTAIPTKPTVPPQPSSRPASVSFAPVRRAGSLDGGAPGSEQPAAGRPVNEATMGFVRDHEAAPSIKRLYGFRGFESPVRKGVMEPPVLSYSHGNRFDSREVYEFENANAFSSLSPKFGFGVEEETPTTTRAKPRMTPTYSPSPARGGLLITQESDSPPSGSKGVRTESNAHKDVNRNRTRFRMPKKMHGLKGFGSPPHEGAEALVREPGKSPTVRQDSEGFELGSSRIWQPKSRIIHRWYDQSGEAERDGGETSPQSRSNPRSEAFQTLEYVWPSRFLPEEYKKNHKTYAFLGFQPQKHRKHTKQNPPTQSPTFKIAPAYIAPVWGLPAESSLKSEAEGEPAAIRPRPLHISTSSTARGTRVTGKRRQKLYKSPGNSTQRVAIVRLPKSPLSAT